MSTTVVDNFVSRSPSEILSILGKALPVVQPKARADLERIIAAVSQDASILFSPPRGNFQNEAELAQRWVRQYVKARDASTLTRQSNGVTTKADEVIDVLIAAALGESSFSSPRIGMIREGHRLSMEAENLIGTLLEEYLDENLSPAGWACCWGSVVRAVDFIGPKAELLQVKNKSNSENSSSSRVRHATRIKKWHRLDANSGTTHWPKLQEITGVRDMSEMDFHSFARERIKQNPRMLSVPRELSYPPAPGGRTT